MKKIIKPIVTGCMLFLLLLAMPVNAQEQQQPEEKKAPAYKEAYDPLIPQLFAFDKKNNIFAGISNVNNTIDLIRYEGDQLIRSKSVVVDIVEKRHDTHHIYRPKSVAIYQDYVVFLASHRDSCYLAVLDMNGNIVKKLTFAGEASAFSYSEEAKELYIAGETETGYDVIALDASRGVNNIDLQHAAALHYQKPRMSEVIAKADPWGVGMAAVAMSVVFLSLLLLYLVFKNVGKTLISVQDRRRKKHDKPIDKPVGVSTADTSGEVYAAISAAIHLYNEELHDEQDTVLTINKVSRTYSPWSSKLHGLNTYFNRR